MIAIVNYGMGNLHSVEKRLISLGANVCVTDDPNRIYEADKLILPGVGHFGKAMEAIEQTGMQETLNEAVLVKKTPVLGICLGLQLMTNSSEESGDGRAIKGLGWLDADVVRFKITNTLRYKVPHTGWNRIKVLQENHPLFKGLDDKEFYFVHAYHLRVNDPKIALNTTEHETPFVSAAGSDHIMGVQYHPEKSHDAGNLLLKNFLEM